MFLSGEDLAFSAGVNRLGTAPNGEIRVAGAEWDDFEAYSGFNCPRAMFGNGWVCIRGPSGIMGSFAADTVALSPTCVPLSGVEGNCVVLEDVCSV